jgi:endonuclease VIII
MPEGPSIVILKEAVAPFKKKKIIAATGNTKSIDLEWLNGKTVTDFKSWGKHFLICFKGKTIRIHFLLFGSYLINEEKAAPPRLSLQFSNGELNFYSCSVKELEASPDETYEWSADVMNPSWDSKKARQKLKEKGSEMLCDVLLDQHIFAGVGNIIKNEVLYRIKVHPENKVSALPPRKLTQMIAEAVNYSFDFLKWKKEFTLRKHWLAHTKNTCTRCNLPIYKKYAGKTKRRTFFCTNCQVLYT